MSDCLTVISRREARELGVARYFTGKPCIHGHLSERYTASKACIACALTFAKEQYRRNPERSWAALAAWKAANPDRAAARVANWHAANPERIREIKAGWEKRNPDKVRARTANARARRRNAEGAHTAAEIEEVLKRQKGRCANSGCQVKLGTTYHRDHIVPLARGGTNYIRNIQLLCRRCNISKGAKHPTEWARRNGLLV